MAQIFFLQHFKNKIIYNFLKFVAPKKGLTTNFFSLLSFVPVFGFGMGKKQDPGSGIISQIRNTGTYGTNVSTGLAESHFDAVQEEVRKAKIAANEEKSAKLFTERKVKDLARRIEEMDKEMAQVSPINCHYFTVFRI